MRFIIPFLLLGSVACQDSIEVYGFGLSKHFDKQEDYQEVNPGLGLGYIHQLEMDYEASYKANFTLIAGQYQDSYRETARFLMPGVRFIWGEAREYHIWGGANAGYFYGSKFIGIGIMPSIGAGWDRYDIGFTGGQGMVACFAKVEVLRW